MTIELLKMLKCLMLKADKFQVLGVIVTLELRKIFQEFATFTKDRFLLPHLKPLLS
jgi:hypothetical protein